MKDNKKHMYMFIHVYHLLLSDMKNWKKDLARFWVRHLCGLYKVLFREDILQLLKMMRLKSG